MGGGAGGRGGGHVGVEQISGGARRGVAEEGRARGGYERGWPNRGHCTIRPRAAP